MPESWLEVPARPDQAGVPEHERRSLAKGETALELLDAVRAENVLPGRVVAGRFAWLRVWPVHGWATGECAGQPPVWLLIEEPPDGTIKYAFSNLPADTTRLAAVRLWRERWKSEPGYQQMKGALGLDHFEDRSWRGFHHHAALVMLAFGFLALEQLRAKQEQRAPAKAPTAGIARKKAAGTDPASDHAALHPPHPPATPRARR